MLRSTCRQSIEQLTEALAATAGSCYTTCDADTAALLATCSAVEEWLVRDIDIDATRATSVPAMERHCPTKASACIMPRKCFRTNISTQCIS